MTMPLSLADIGSAIGFATRLVFGIWPILMIGPLTRRRHRMVGLLVLWLVLATLRGVALLTRVPALGFVLPEPYSTFAFMLVGVIVFFVMFVKELATWVDQRERRAARQGRGRRLSSIAPPVASTPSTDLASTVPVPISAHRDPDPGATESTRANRTAVPAQVANPLSVASSPKVHSGQPARTPNLEAIPHRAEPSGVDPRSGAGIVVRDAKSERLWSLATTAKSPRDFQGLSGDDFELLIVEVYNRLGHHTRRVGQWGDHGVDIIVNAKNGQKWIVQCKRWTRRWIGEPLVRDLFGSMHHEGAERCVLVTTSFFSHPARAWARGKPIDLIDGRQLLHLVQHLPEVAVD